MLAEEVARVAANRLRPPCMSAETSLHNKGAISREAKQDQSAIDSFHRLYYESGVWMRTSWLGVPTQKCPLDLWIYQEILQELRPDLIIETGTASGGSALYLASICDLLGKGRILSIDIDARPERPQHARVRYLHGSSVAPEIIDEVRSEMAGARCVLVILDSDHAQAHVERELQLYAPLVTPGSWLIVEDTNVNGRPVAAHHGPGPAEALEAFLARTNEFEVDVEREKFFMTFNPKGFLRRRR